MLPVSADSFIGTAVDKAYGPKDVYDLARNGNTDAAVYNGMLSKNSRTRCMTANLRVADSWTMVAEGKCPE